MTCLLSHLAGCHNIWLQFGHQMRSLTMPDEVPRNLAAFWVLTMEFLSSCFSRICATWPFPEDHTISNDIFRTTISHLSHHKWLQVYRSWTVQWQHQTFDRTSTIKMALARNSICPHCWKIVLPCYGLSWSCRSLWFMWSRWNISLLFMKSTNHRRMPLTHDDVIKWKLFPRYWPFVPGIHRSLVNSPHRGQWRGALMFSLKTVE